MWDTLLAARESYRAAVSVLYDEVLWEIAGRAEATGSLGKTDIAALIVWKRMSAQTRWAADLMAQPESAVRSVTGRALEAVRRSDMSRAEKTQRVATTIDREQP